MPQTVRPLPSFPLPSSCLLCASQSDGGVTHSHTAKKSRHWWRPSRPSSHLPRITIQPIGCDPRAMPCLCSQPHVACMHAVMVTLRVQPSFRYCECFASGRFCDMCNCMNCANNELHRKERSQAIQAILDRNPTAFYPKIAVSALLSSWQETYRCRCTREWPLVSGRSASMHSPLNALAHVPWLHAAGWQRQFKAFQGVQLQEEWVFEKVLRVLPGVHPCLCLIPDSLSS